MDTYMEDQFIYVMVNEAMPDFIKIGKTNDISRRLTDLDWTNLPLPFQIYYAGRVENADFAERQIHSIFADNRIRSNREFFKVNPERVVAAIKLIELENATPPKDKGVSPEVQEELEKIYRKRFNFASAEVPIGAELIFTRDPNIKAKVVNGGNIEVDGEKMSLSKAAQKALGVDYPAQGPIYWKYEDETLDERRRRIESSGGD